MDTPCFRTHITGNTGASKRGGALILDEQAKVLGAHTNTLPLTAACATISVGGAQVH